MANGYCVSSTSVKPAMCMDGPLLSMLVSCMRLPLMLPDATGACSAKVQEVALLHALGCTFMRISRSYCSSYSSPQWSCLCSKLVHSCIPCLNILEALINSEYCIRKKMIAQVSKNVHRQSCKSKPEHLHCCRTAEVYVV